MKLTNLERNYLQLIAYCEMNQSNGAKPETAADVSTYVWADERSADMGISEKAIGGVMASLIAKGLIVVGDDEPDNFVSFTQAGFEAFEAF